MTRAAKLPAGLARCLAERLRCGVAAQPYREGGGCPRGRGVRRRPYVNGGAPDRIAGGAAGHRDPDGTPAPALPSRHCAG